MLRPFLLLICFLFFYSVSAQTRVDTLLGHLYSDDVYVLVAAHRGDWRNAPENSIPALKNSIAMGADIMELDVQMTKDSVLVLMHDATLNRTTTGKGKVSDYTLAEIKQLYLRNGANAPGKHRIPTFEEIMLIAKDKILINVDKGYDYFKRVYLILKKTHTLRQAIIKTTHTYEKVLVENGPVMQEVPFMPIIHLDKPDANRIIETYQKQLSPVSAFELVFEKDTAYYLKHYSLLKPAKIWYNDLWDELCAGHTGDKAVEEGNIEDSWGWLLQYGAKIIQTDRPQALIHYLQAIKRH